MIKKTVWIVIGIAIVILLLNGMLFSVDETQYAIVTQFGKPVAIIKKPGLQFKMPDPIQSVLIFEKRLLTYDPKPSEFLTSDRKNIVVNNFICWKIKEPEKFFQTVKDIRGAEIRLADIMLSETGTALGKYPLHVLVSTEPNQMKVSEIMSVILKRCRETASKEYGIEIVDIKMKRLILPPINKESVFERMRTEREQIAIKYKAEGQEEAIKIRAEAHEQEEEILAKAYMNSQKIMGKGDAESMSIYTQAYEKNIEFYTFMRTLEAYKKMLDSKTTLVLSADSKLWELLTKGVNIKRVINNEQKK